MIVLSKLMLGKVEKLNLKLILEKKVILENNE